MKITGHSVHEVHGFEFPAKTIFANNLKTIDLRVVYYVYLSLAQLSWSKKCELNDLYDHGIKLYFLFAV